VVTAVGQQAFARLRRRARRLDGATLRALSPMLILSPHQDDETLGCGGLIATACAMGLTPRVAYLTDGAASHPGSPSWPPARLAAARRGEALRALLDLGVPAADVAFLGWPDAAPWPSGSRPRQSTLLKLEAWNRARPARSVWATWRGEPHCDHEATAFLADDLAARLPGPARRFDYLVWGWGGEEVASGDNLAWSLDCPGTIPARRRALSRHRTQMSGLIGDAAEAFRLPQALAALTLRRSEVYLEAR
jgi:LmbE family N-acetylglucosaminyl deacetylase